MFSNISSSLNSISDIMDKDTAYYLFTTMVNELTEHTSFENLTNSDTKYAKFFELFYDIKSEDHIRAEVLFLLLYEYKTGALDIKIMIDYLDQTGFSIKNAFEYLRLSSDIYVADRYYHYMKYLNQHNLDLSNGTSKNLFIFLSEKYDYARGYYTITPPRSLNILYPNIEYHRSSSKFRNYREAMEAYDTQLKNFIASASTNENSAYIRLKNSILTNNNPDNVYKILKDIFTNITSYGIYSDRSFLSLPNRKIDAFTGDGHDLRLFFVRYGETEREDAKLLTLYNNISCSSDFLSELDRFLKYTITKELGHNLEFSNFKEYIKTYYDYLINNAPLNINIFKSIAFCNVIIKEFFEEGHSEIYNDEYIRLIDLLVDLSEEIITYISSHEPKFTVKNALASTYE